MFYVLLSITAEVSALFFSKENRYTQVLIILFSFDASSNIQQLLVLNPTS